MCTLDYFLLINKAKGLTSFQVIAKLRKILKVKKIGHSGTLDKLASGLLLIAVGNKATKFLEFMIKMDKVYSVSMIFGFYSDSYDLDSEVKLDLQSLELAQNLDLKMVKNCLDSFIGEIDQMPPVYSALKINGKRASDMARNAENVRLKSRKIKIYDINDLSVDEIDFQNVKIYKYQFTVSCSSGTYIRSLVHDIGEKLDCKSVMYNLTRLQIGSFSLDQAVDLNDSMDLSQIFSISKVASLLFSIVSLDFDEYSKLKYGQKIFNRFDLNDKFLVAFYNDRLISILERQADMLKVYKNFI